MGFSIFVVELTRNDPLPFFFANSSKMYRQEEQKEDLSEGEILIKSLKTIQKEAQSSLSL